MKPRPSFGFEETTHSPARGRSSYRVELSDVELDRAIEGLEILVQSGHAEPHEQSQAVRALAKLRKARG